MNYQMVPSLKFTLIAWVAFIGLGSVSLALKAKKGPNSVHHTNAVVIAATKSSRIGVVSITKTYLSGTKR